VRKDGDIDFFQNSQSEPFADFPGTEQNLTQRMTEWVEKERFPTFVEISRGNFQTLLDTSKFIVMAVVDQDRLGRLTPEMTE